MSRLVRRTSGRLPVHDLPSDTRALRREPVLIGPPCAGKSTLARLLSERSGRPVVCLDALRHTLLPVLGCDLERAEAFARGGDHAQWCRYVRPFEHLMLEWVLGEHRDVVFDVGAGFVLPIDAPVDDAGAGKLPQAVATRLAAFSAVVHVTPSLLPTAIELHCLERLAQRHGPAACGDEWMVDVGRYYACRSAAYARLASFEVWTGQETPVRSVERIEAFMAGLVRHC